MKIKTYLFLVVILTISCTRVEKKYYTNGQLKYKAQLDNDNNWHGKVINYYSNGNVEFESNYVHGQPNDLARFYYSNGVLKMVKPFQDGKLNGVVKGYDSCGYLNYTGEYLNDRFLNYTWYDTNGKIDYRFYYLDTNNLPRFEDFEIKLTVNSEHLFLGDTVSIDIKHDSLLRHQYSPTFTNGTLIFEWEKDSFMYRFTPRRLGHSKLFIELKINDSISKRIGNMDFEVIEKRN